MANQKNANFMEEYKHRMRNLGSVIMREPEAQNAMNNCILAMEKIAIQLASIDYENLNPCDKCHRKGIEPEGGAKSLSYIAKVVNETTRLLEYAKGNADQRSEIKGLEDLLKVLSQDQFTQVCAWIEAREFDKAKELN
jgi:cytochrome c553